MLHFERAGSGIFKKIDQEEERAVIGKNNKLRLGWRSTETEGPVLDIKYVAL